MATLVQEFEARIPLKRRVQLTRLDDPDAGTQDDAVAGKAADDVTGDFVTFAGIALDTSKKEHVAYGIRGMLLYLAWYKDDSKDNTDRLEKWQKSMNEGLRLVAGNDRIVPKSSSKLTPADETQGGAQVGPLFDVNTSFDDIIPGEGSSGGTSRRINLP